MRAYVGVTDRDWFEFLSRERQLDEVNFWQPGGTREFKALKPGELFLFKLRSPDHRIVGGGVFAHASLLPVSIAWDAFGIANGAPTLAKMRALLARYRGKEVNRFEDYRIGCVLLEQPFFLTPDRWVAPPEDWSRNIVQGKTYDLREGEGRLLWERLKEAWVDQDPAAAQSLTSEGAPRYGDPVLTRPRLGQASFRVLVTDAYERRCSVTGERVLPVLEAAHIRPYAVGGEHRVENGLLLRRDLHALFDRGYVTVTPELRLEVSRRIREDWENGRDYYALQGGALRPPGRPHPSPDESLLEWHNENVFLG